MRSTSVRLPEDVQVAFDLLVERATAEHWAERLFDHDASLWTDDPDVSTPE